MSREPRDAEEPLPPIWARPEPPGRGPRAALGRKQIVDVALLIADEEGLEAVSMRRLARELRSGAMSLYHYFQSRDELLDLMGDSVAAEMLVPVAAGGLARRAAGDRAAHPPGVPEPSVAAADAAGPPAREPEPAAPHRAVGAGGASLGAKLEPSQLNGIVMAVDDYTVGYTLRELAAGDGAGEDRARKIAMRFREQWEQPWVRYLLDSGEFPMLSQFLTMDDPPPSLSFEDGLDWLLDGFAARHGL